jgi:hypothetical protein
MACADGSLRSLLIRLGRIDALVIDDWAMAPLSEPDRRDVWEICKDRYQVRSTILRSGTLSARSLFRSPNDGHRGKGDIALSRHKRRRIDDGA